MTDFIFRDARPADKDEVLALTAHTWQGGDYIQWVFDDWVSDPTGRLLVAEDTSTGRIAGIDKMSFLSPTEAWFEGLRVHPDFRGRGLSTRFEKHMISEAARLGARTIRLLTNVGNLAVHRNTYRHGFAQRFVVRYWGWPPKEGSGGPAHQPVPALDIRPATPEEAPALYHWWLRTPACQATTGLLNRHWSYSATSSAEWVERAANDELLVPQETEVSGLALPPPMALVSRRTNGHEPECVMAALSAPAGAWAPLAAGLIANAQARGAVRVEGLLPDTVYIYSALKQAGFITGSDADCLSLFELDLP